MSLNTSKLIIKLLTELFVRHSDSMDEQDYSPSTTLMITDQILKNELASCAGQFMEMF